VALVATSVRVSELWRYPVKSMRGERVDVAELREDGVAGDRLVHVRESSGRVATSRFRPGCSGWPGRWVRTVSRWSTACRGRRRRRSRVFGP